MIAIIPPTNTSTPTHSTKTPIKVPPRITSTPTITFTPPPPDEVLFFDNFNDGLDDGWDVVVGEPQITKKQLTASTETWIETREGINWLNYKIEFKCAEFYGDDIVVGIWVKDIRNMLAVQFSRSDTMFVTYANGIKSEILSTRDTQNIRFSDPSNVTIFAQNNQVAVFINGEEVTSYVYQPKLSNGKVALFIPKEDSFGYIDDFKITSLP